MIRPTVHICQTMFKANRHESTGSIFCPGYQCIFQKLMIESHGSVESALNCARETSIRTPLDLGI